MSKYGVLLIGAKRTHQEGHAAAFKAHPLCDLTAVSDERDIPESVSVLNRQLAEELSIPYIPDLTEALARDDVQIVSSTPAVERRGRVAVQCINAGKHVYLDKPLAGTLAEIDSIADASAKATVRTQMFSLINASWVRAAKDAIQQGLVGELKAVHVENLFAIGTVRQEKERADRFTYIEAKREMFDVGVYCIGIVHWLTGRKTESVSCITGNYFYREHANVDVEDFGALALTLQDNLSATILGGRIGWTSHPKSGPQRIVLFGSKNTMTFDPYRPRIEIYNDSPDFMLPPMDPVDPMGMWGASNPEYEPIPKRRWISLDENSPMERDVASFLDCIEKDREPDMNASAAAPLVEVILAGYMSASKGKTIWLPLPRE